MNTQRKDDAALDQQLYNRGYAAYWAKKPENPNIVGSRDFKMWEDGFAAAQDYDIEQRREQEWQVKVAKAESDMRIAEKRARNAEKQRRNKENRLKRAEESRAKQRKAGK